MITHSKPTLNESDAKLVCDQLSFGEIANGVKVVEFERRISTANNVLHSIAVASGSMALYLSLKALRLKVNAEVILPSYVCKSVIQVVKSLELFPVLCDINAFWVSDFQTIKSKITENTGAIILVHTFGIDAWTEDMNEFNIPVIEDFCQAFNVHTYVGRKLKGEIGICSFNATKCLTTGEGGAIITNSNEVHLNIKEEINFKKTISIFSDLQATLGISQINRYDFFIEKRKKLAENYLQGIKDKRLVKSYNDIKNKTINFRFLIKAEMINTDIIEKAKSRRIALKKGVDAMLHVEEKIAHDYFQNTLNCFNHTVSLPIYPDLKDEEQEKIIDFVNEL